MLKESLELICKESIEDILQDGKLSLLLINTYGMLYNCKPYLCEKSLRKYHRELKLTGNEKLNKMEKNKKYIMKEGVVIYDAKNHCHYSKFNITDDKAEKLLKNKPQLIVNFEKVPEVVLTAKEIIKKVETMDAEGLKEFENDKRVTVKKAIADRKKELNEG